MATLCRNTTVDNPLRWVYLVATMTTPTKSTRQRVTEMKASVMSVREIASALGLSTQAVYKHLGKLRDEVRGRKAS